jgi:hypothetical protein
VTWRRRSVHDEHIEVSSERHGTPTAECDGDRLGGFLRGCSTDAVDPPRRQLDRACGTHIAGCCGHGLHGVRKLGGGVRDVGQLAGCADMLLRIAMFFSKSKGNEGCTTL